jgi:MFS family permease
MQMVAKGWFLYALTGSPFLLGLMGAASGIPMFALSFLGGVIADRVDKRQLLLFGTLGQGLTMLSIALLVVLGAIVWWHLLVASAIQGMLFALTTPARQSAVPQLVKGDQIMNAMSINTAGMNVSSLLAPALAGFLVAFIGIGGVYWIITALFVVSAVIMLGLPHLPPKENGHSRNMAQDMTEGLRFVRKDTALVLLLVVTFIAVAFGTPLNSLLPVFSEDILKVGPSGLGLLLSLSGVGALVGSLSMASLGDFQRKGIALLMLTILWGGSVIAFTATSIYPLALFLMVPIGIGQSGRNVLVNTLILSRSPAEVRGRVISLSMMMWGLQPLGLLPIGAAAEVIGAPWAIAIGGALVVASSLGFLAFSSTLRRL